MRTLYRTFPIAALAAILFIASASVARCEEGLWQTDFEAAKAKALAEKKLLLVDFTGSDWCGWCIKLHDEVFDKEEFKAAAPKNFVLVQLDFPHKKELPADLKAQNEGLAKKYKVKGFPTILLLDPKGDVVAHSGYRPGGAEKYIDNLASLVTAHDAVVKLRGELAKAQGIAKAKLLDGLIEKESELGAEDDELTADMKEAVALDPDNKAGLKAKYGVRLAMAEFSGLMQDKKFKDAQAAIDKLLAMPGLSDDQKQDAYIALFSCLRAKEDLAGCVDVLKKADEIVPDGPKSSQIKMMLKQLESMAKSQAKALELKAELDKTKGPERLKMLDQVLEAYAKIGNRVNFKVQTEQVEKWIQEVNELDPDNKAGLKSKYESVSFFNEGLAEMMHGNMAKAEKSFDKALEVKGIGAEQIQHVSLMKAQICLAKRDVQGAIDCATKGIDAAPDSKTAGQLKQVLARAKMEKPNEE